MSLEQLYEEVARRITRYVLLEERICREHLLGISDADLENREVTSRQWLGVALKSRKHILSTLFWRWGLAEDSKKQLLSAVPEEERDSNYAIVVSERPIDELSQELLSSYPQADFGLLSELHQKRKSLVEVKQPRPGRLLGLIAFASFFGTVYAFFAPEPSFLLKTTVLTFAGSIMIALILMVGPYGLNQEEQRVYSAFSTIASLSSAKLIVWEKTWCPAGQLTQQVLSSLRMLNPRWSESSHLQS